MQKLLVQDALKPQQHEKLKANILKRQLVVPT